MTAVDEISTPASSNHTFLSAFCLYVGIPGVVGIAIGGMVGEGGLTGVIRGVFTGRRGMGFCT